MKFSTAMLKGYKKVGGKQCAKNYQRGDAVCAHGAANLAVFGKADLTREPHGIDAFPTFSEEMRAFRNAWDIDVVDLNDEGMPWEHIYGMARAAGV